MISNQREKDNFGIHVSQKHNQKTKIDLAEMAQYIADMVLELRNLAKAADLLTLQALLEVSFYEAFAVANKVPMPEGEIEHLRELSKASAGQ